MTANWKCAVTSKHIGVVFPNELVEKLTREARSEGMSFPRVVRCACIEYLSRRNVDVSSIPNPVSRGERTDLLSKRPIVHETSKHNEDMRRIMEVNRILDMSERRIEEIKRMMAEVEKKAREIDKNESASVAE